MLVPLGRTHLVADRFELHDLAGTGGAASVYRATDRQSGQVVAVKILRSTPHAEGLGRFAREAQLLSDLSHEGIVRYLTHGQSGSDLYLVTEWLDGLSLGQRVARTVLSLDDCLALGRSVASALGAAHARGIIHRDVKPANIFLVDGDPRRAKLLDFGIARLRSISTELTRTGMVIGTPGYMAPEQARGDRALDARADLFSLGCVLFRCLTGRRAFTGDDVMAVLAKVLLGEPEPVSALRPDVPPELERLVGRMLAKAPEDRPASAEAVIDALASLERSTNSEPPTMQLGSSLTTDERRMMCVLLARGGPDEEANRERLEAAVGGHGGRLEMLADRSLLVVVEGTGSPTDHAMRAARCALAMRTVAPMLPMVLAAGEGELRERVAGPVIDRGAALLATLDGSTIRLDEVMATLLAGRFELRGARGVASLLGEIEASPSARTFLGRPSTCVGRERDLAMLEVSWQECVEESIARIVLVTGAPGIGKTRLLDEFLRRIRGGGRAVEIWVGRGDPMSARAPFGMIAEPIRHASSIRSREEPAERQRKLRARVAGSVPPDDQARVTEFLAEVIGAPFTESQSVELRAARHDPQLMGDQIRRAWEDWLDAESGKHPILLVLEDLHWGDLPSVKLIDAAARHLAERPFMVLALARPEIYQWFPGIWNDRNLTELRLRSLTEKAAQRLVREALGATAGQATVKRIVERGHGNPFFLEELVRAMVDGKGEELPTTVLAMVQARLGDLSVEARRFLRAASIFGKVFSIDGVLALLGADEGDTPRQAWLSELVAKDVLERPQEARFHGQLAFHHALVHEAAYSMLTEADRKLGHRLAAEWLERTGGSDPVVLAEHFERGGELARAVGWYWRAAEQGLEGNDYEAAIQRVEKALRCGATGEDEGALRLIESEARRWRGENELSKTAAVVAMERLPRGSPRWCSAAGELAAVSGALGDTDHLVAIAIELEAVEPLGDRSPLISALAAVARPLFWAGKHRLASRMLARAAEIERGATDLQPTVLASLYMARGVEARLLGDPSECLHCNGLAVAESERAGDLRGGSAARGNLGYAYLEIGAHADAERTLGEALAMAQRLGLPLIVAIAQQNLGLALGRRGAFEAAAKLELASYAAFAAQGDFRRAGCSLLYLALIEMAGGRLDDAERSARRSVEMLAEMPPLRASAMAVLAQIELARGETARGIASAAQAHALLTQLGGIDEGESRIRLVQAEALRAAGDEDAGRRAIAEARDHLLARAAKIRDEHRRKAFLEEIPENARTLELARAWGC